MILDMEDIKVDETDTVVIRPRAFDPDNDRLVFTVSDPIGNDFRWKTNYQDNGDYEIDVTVSDGELTDTKKVRVFVENINRIPMFESISPVTAGENEEVIIPISVLDPDKDPVELYLEDAPEGAELVNNTLRYKSGYDIAGKDGVKEVLITLVAADWKSTVKQTVLIKVKDVNRAPVMIESNPAEKVKAYLNEPVVFSTKTMDYDDDTLSYSWRFGAFGKAEGAAAMKRTFKRTGTKTIKLIVSDGDASITKKWEVDVIGKRPKPIVPKTKKVLKFSVDNNLAKDAVTTVVIE